MNAIRRAVVLANQCDAALTLLHVIDVNAQAQPGRAEDFMQRLWQDGSTQLAHLACALAGQVEAQTMLAEGLPWEVITAKSGEYDLLILAEKGSPKGCHLFSRKTARRVIKHAACPVMVVHEHT